MAMAIIWPGCQVPVDQVMILEVVHSLGYLEAPHQQVAQPATESLLKGHEMDIFLKV